MFDNIMKYTIGLLIALAILFFVFVTIKNKISKIIDRRKANKGKHKSLADVGAREEKIKNKEKELDNREKAIEKISEDMEQTRTRLLDEFETKKNNCLNQIDTKSKNLENAKYYHLSQASEYKKLTETFPKDFIANFLIPLRMSENMQNRYIVSLCSERGHRAFSEEMIFSEIHQASCIVKSSSGEYYETSLNKCTCDDYRYRGVICKHMLAFAVRICDLNVKYNELNDKYSENLTQIWETTERLKALEKDIKDARKELEKLENKCESTKRAADMAEKEFHTLIEKKCEAFPIFASMYADVCTYYYSVAAKELCDKPRPAKKAAETIKKLRAEAKKCLKEKNEMEYKFGALLQLYPDAKKIFNNDFDIENPPILIPYLPEATNHKKHRGTT